MPLWAKTTAIRSPVLTGGAGAGSFLYLQDGVPLRAAGFGNVNGLFEAHTEQAGSIEVVRGPGSALYGSNAVHGMINVLSRAPSKAREIDLGLGVGPHGLRSGKVSYGDSLGAHGVRLDLLGTHDGGYRDNSGFEQSKATFRHDVAVAADSLKTVASAQKLDQETAGFVVGVDAYKDGSLNRTNPNPDAFRNAESARLSSRWDHDMDAGMQLSLTPYVRHTDMEFLMHFLPSQALEENGHDSVGLLAAMYLELGGGHQLILGTDVEYTEGFLKEFQSIPTVFSYVQGLHYDYEVDAIVAAPFVHGEFQLSPDFRLTAGLRFEYTEYDYRNNADNVTVGRFQRIADRTDRFEIFTPKLGATYHLGEAVSLYGNISRGARAPQTTDLYRLQLNQNIGEIEAEKLDSAELGLRGDRFGASFDLSGYFMKKRNFFFRDVDGFNVVNGRTRHVGVEAALGYEFSEDFDISANVTYARHTYDFDNDVASTANSTEAIQKGDDVDSAPRTIGNVRLGWNILGDARAELEWVHMGKYYMDASNTRDYDGHDIFNLRARWDINDRFSLDGRITNLFDTEYAERADFFFGTERYFPGEKRYFHLGATARF